MVDFHEIATPYRKGENVGYRFDPTLFKAPLDAHNEGGLYLFNQHHHSWPVSYDTSLINNIRVETSGYETEIETTVLCAVIRLYANLFDKRITFFEVNEDHLRLDVFPNKYLVEGINFIEPSDIEPAFTLTTEKQFATLPAIKGVVLTIPNVEGELSNPDLALKDLKTTESFVACIMCALCNGYNEDPLTFSYEKVCGWNTKGAFIERTYRTLDKCIRKIPNESSYKKPLFSKDIQILGFSAFVDYYLHATQITLNPFEGFNYIHTLTKELNSYLGTEKLFGGRSCFAITLTNSFENLTYFLKRFGIV